MRGILHVMAALAVMALGFWAYHENYKTQASMKSARALSRDIGAAHERIGILNAEWAYQNRPDRLRDLANLNFDRLGLLPLSPEAFGRVDQVTYPPAPMLPITNPIDVSSDNAANRATDEEPL